MMTVETLCCVEVELHIVKIFTGYWNGLRRARPVASTAEGGFGRTDRGLELALGKAFFVKLALTVSKNGLPYYKGFYPL